MSRATPKRARRRGSGSELTFADLERARASRAPDFAEQVCRYVLQPDPKENQPEEPSDKEFPELPEDAWTLSKLRASVAETNMWGKSPDEQWATRRAAWQSLMASPYPPPRLRLGDMMLEMYAEDDAWSRQALFDVFKDAQLGWGLWRGFKGIYKLAETAHDAEMLGLLACRLDILQRTRTTSEIGNGTAIYMRRRAWRYLRVLGRAIPEAFPIFACQVLRHYPRDMSLAGTWVASQIWAHEAMIGETSGAWFDGPREKLEERAYNDSWKISPDPLLRLLEDAENDTVCTFSIRCLEADFAEVLRTIEPAWLARIAGKRLPTVDGFVVKLLQENPEFHRSKLAGLGLEDMVVALLGSHNEDAVRYAIDYCNAHSPKIEWETLITLADQGTRTLQEFVIARLEKAPPKELGVALLIRMLGISSLENLAERLFKSGFRPSDIEADTYATLRFYHGPFIENFYVDAKAEVPTGHIRRFAEFCAEIGGSRGRRALRTAMRELGERPGSEIGAEWLKERLFDPTLGTYVNQWLSRGMLKGDELDVEWLKGLVARPSWRDLALGLLGDPALVAPHRIGSEYLLKAARHSDPRVFEFAHSYLLHHFSPLDFAMERGSERASDGVDTLFGLLESSDASIRKFAASYLTLHHPELSRSSDEIQALGIKPQLSRADYSAERMRPLLFHPRLDVRVFAAEVARAELIRWNEPGLAYDLAASHHRETRVIGGEALLGIGMPAGEGTFAPPLEWLDADRAFAMAESPQKATREIAVTLIRQHYGRIGSAHKLAWLMDSPDREVRLFAVRLLWDRHRPIPGPRGEKRERFDSTQTLREFVRTVLFGLPPGRMERRDGTSAEKPLASSVAKRRVVELIRDMAVTDAEFAKVVSPVLEEFLASQAKGEWHSCVTALAHMRAAHPELEIALPRSAI